MTQLATVYFVVVAAAFGLAIGSFLNVVVYRVPAGISLLRESRCPVCEAPVRPAQNVPVLSWLALRGACATCGARISPRYPLVELATGAAFAFIAWGGVQVGLVSAYSSVGVALSVSIAFLYLAAISIALALIDLDTRRLPNVIVLPGYPILLGLFAAATLCGAPVESLLRALVAGAALFAFYALVRALRPGGMGGGDVKLAGVLGLALGWVGWGSVVVGAFAAFVVGGVVGIILILTRRVSRKSAIPFGPWMLVGAWVGIFAGEPLASWYIGMLSVG